MSEKLRLPAEESYAAELKALAAGDSGPRPPGWALSPRSVVTYLMGGKAERRHGDHAEICRRQAADRDRHRDARHRSRAAAARRAGHGQVVGVGTSRRRDHRQFDARHPVHGGHRRKPDPLWLELRAVARAWAATRGAGPYPADARDGGWQALPFRGADADGQRRAGHADHRALREDDAGPGAEHGDLCAARVQHHRHRQQPRQGRQ